MSKGKTTGATFGGFGSLQAQLAKLGVATASGPGDDSPADVDTSPSVRAITDRYIHSFPDDASVSDAIAWMQRWYDEVCAAGYQSQLDEAGVCRPRAEGEPADAAELETLEIALGVALCPSHRELLASWGTIAWTASDATLPASGLAAHLDELRTVIGCAQRPELAPYGENAALVPLRYVSSDFAFMLRNERDDLDESPVYFVRHDDAGLEWRGTGVVQWLHVEFESAMDRFADGAD